MNIFVLGTGRCGTTTFATACSYFDNYTSGHETRARRIGSDRFDYPDDHVEVDNRLSWLLGGLAARFDQSDVLYVHLRRHRADVLSSFVARFDSPFRTNIMRAFGHGIISRASDWEECDIERVCGFYIDTVTANIDEFLRSRQSTEMWLEDLPQQFPSFVDRIEATGNIDGAMLELGVRHNKR